MTEQMDTFQALLAKMREDFVNEIPDRCFAFEELILKLEKSSGDVDAFNELFRGVHSLKGSGGTHGLSIFTAISHQLENLLTEARSSNEFKAEFVTQALAHVDLIRQVVSLLQSGKTDFSIIESQLESLKRSVFQDRKSILIVDSSRLMAGLYRETLGRLPIQISFLDNGLTALGRLLHEHFDLVIVGRELKELGGVPMMAAIRLSQVRQRDIPAILVSSKEGGFPESAGFNVNIMRDKNLAANLLTAVKSILHL